MPRRRWRWPQRRTRRAEDHRPPQPPTCLLGVHQEHVPVSTSARRRPGRGRRPTTSKGRAPTFTPTPATGKSALLARARRADQVARSGL